MSMEHLIYNMARYWWKVYSSLEYTKFQVRFCTSLLGITYYRHKWTKMKYVYQFLVQTPILNLI